MSPGILVVGSRIIMCAEETIFRGLFLKKSRVQIQRENLKVGQSCLCLLAQESSMDEGNRAWGLGGGAGRKGTFPHPAGESCGRVPKD